MRFDEVGLISGVARDDLGQPNGSMGVAVGDYLNAGRPSIFVTNYENQPHALYRNDGDEQFAFQTRAAGILNSGVGWGVGFVDLDNRGALDLVVANGHVVRFPQRIGISQQPLLLRNSGRGRFKDITIEAGDYFRQLHGGRGIAFGDLANRGLTDLLISHVNEPLALLKNLASLPAEGGNHWLGIALNSGNHSDVVGARIEIVTAAGRQTRFAVGGGSYLSSSDPRHLFGLGQEMKATRVTVYWPSGEPRVQTWDNLDADRYWKLEQGKQEAIFRLTPSPHQPEAQAKSF
jgi:hypothetical protein